jgi:hypothetical protein
MRNNTCLRSAPEQGAQRLLLIGKLPAYHLLLSCESKAHNKGLPHSASRASRWHSLSASAAGAVWLQTLARTLHGS